MRNGACPRMERGADAWLISKDPLLYVGLIRGGRMSDQSQHVGKGALASEPFGVALVDGEACLWGFGISRLR